MNLTELKQTSLLTIENLKNFGIFPKENNLYDYKLELNFFGLTDVTEIFLRNFAKDILSFSNGNSGIILLGILEDEKTGDLNDIGLDAKNLELLNKLDLNLVSQKFEKIAKVCVSLDLQSFQSGTRKFYCLLIEKQNQVIIPINDFPD
ncbi:ATP-binding protein, partial [Flavobacterium psychrophilum]